MANRSLEAWKSWKDAQLKYDYYIVGLVAALFAYVGSNYVPQKIALSQNTLELVSILLLALSLIIGIKRLEIDLSLQTITLKKCEAEEMKNVANTILAAGGSRDFDTGGFITVTEANERAEEMESAIHSLNKNFSAISNRAVWYFRIRNWLLTLGFIALAGSKVLGAYGI